MTIKNLPASLIKDVQDILTEDNRIMSTAFDTQDGCCEDEGEGLLPGVKEDDIPGQDDSRFDAQRDKKEDETSQVAEAKTGPIRPGDRVRPKFGPHKGYPHKVIHVFGDGRVNIQPIGLQPSKIRYSLGAATAKEEDLIRESLESLLTIIESVVDADGLDIELDLMARNNYSKEWLAKDINGLLSKLVRDVTRMGQKELQDEINEKLPALRKEIQKEWRRNEEAMAHNKTIKENIAISPEELASPEPRSAIGQTNSEEIRVPKHVDVVKEDDFRPLAANGTKTEGYRLLVQYSTNTRPEFIPSLDLPAAPTLEALAAMAPTSQEVLDAIARASDVPHERPVNKGN